MARQSNNTVIYGYEDEATFDTLPTTGYTVWAGVLNDTVAPVPQFIESDEETGQLIVDDHHLVGMSTAGNFPVEYRYTSHDWIMAKALNSAGFSSAETTSSVINVTPGLNTLTLASSTWTAEFPEATRGTWLQIECSAWGANNVGFFRVESGGGSTVLSVSGITAGSSETAEPLSGGNLTITVLSQIVNGTSKSTFAFQRDNPDAGSTDRYTIGLGNHVTGMAMAYDSAKSLFTGSFTVIGTRELPAQAGAITGSETAATTNTQFKTSDVIGFMSGIAQSTPQPIISWSMDITKNDFSFDEIASMRPLEFGLGRMNITGTVTTYYPSNAMFARAISETGLNTTALAIIMQNSQGAYIIDAPSVKLSNPRRGKGPRDTGLVVSYDWLADYHTPSSSGIRICRKNP